MSSVSSNRCRETQRSALFIALISFSVCLTGVFSYPGLRAQTDDQKPPASKKEEVYEKNNKKPKKPIKVDEDDDEPVIKVPSKPKPAATSDLAAAFKGNPVLEGLHKDIGVPHDEVNYDDNKISVRVVPLTEYFAPPEGGAKIKATLQLFEIDQDGIAAKRPSGVMRREFDSITPYEILAINRVDAFLNGNYDRKDPKDKRYLSTEKTLQAASLAMEFVYHNHLEMLKSEQRKGTKWQPVTDQLQAKLLKVHLAYLEYLAANNGWDKSYEAAGKMAGDHLIEAERIKLTQPLLALTEKMLEGNPSEAKLKEGQKRLAQIESKFPGSIAKSASADRLKTYAESLVNQAQELAKKGETQAALDILKNAEAIWPGLPGLHDQQLKLSNTYPVLRVAVRELPVDFLPGLAATDSERWAGELLFEGLVRPNFDPEKGHDYVPVLADSRPRLVPLGRQFSLYRDIRWSDGRKDRLTGADVAHMVTLLKNGKWPGHDSGWSELVEPVHRGKVENQITLTFTRGHLDPLSAMTFKILPKDLTLEFATRFNADPVGSGPFAYSKPTGQANTKEVTFLANNYYWERHRDDAKPDALRKPRIREVRFIKSDDPAHDLADGKLDMIINPPADGFGILSKSAVIEGPIPNRRIYFLALNNTNRFLKNRSLREALAHYINREQILKECFRGELGEKVHRTLNGPFPAGSWACNANVKKLDDRGKAELLFTQAKAEVNLQGAELTLSFPNDDPQVEKAMKLLAEQISGPMGIPIKLDPLDPHVLRKKVEKEQDYDLAYYHYDFPSESYWLGSLLDQNNYLGFRDEGGFQLQALFNQIQNYRYFAQVRELTQTVHERFLTFMPFVPLWQLDTFIAHSKALKFTLRDPLLIFPGAEDWVLERK